MKEEKKKFSYKNIGKDYVEAMNGSFWKQMKWTFKYLAPIIFLWAFLDSLARYLADKFG